MSVVIDRRLPFVILPKEPMTARDTGLSGSYNSSDATSSRSAVEHEQQDSSQTQSSDNMSATTVYSAPYYPPPQTVYNHNPPSNPPVLYRRPSQPAVPIYSNTCTPISASSTFEQQPVDSDNPISRAPPVPSSSVISQFQPGIPHPQIMRSNPVIAPMTDIMSQSHPQISPFPTPLPILNPGVHLDIVGTPVSDIVSMLASKLQNLITTHDRAKRMSAQSNNVFPSPTSSSRSTQTDTRLLSFHARNIPSITITAYLNRILKYCPTDPDVFISVLVYFDRILRIASSHAQPIFGSYFPSSFRPWDTTTPPLVHSAFHPPNHDDDSFTIDSFNVHRLVITIIAVATKFFSDQFYTNSRYARVCLLFLHRTPMCLSCGKDNG